MPVLDSKKLALPFDFQQSSEAVFRTTGKSAHEQTGEIQDLRRAIGLLTPEEYYYYRLFDDARYDVAEKRRFLGRAAQQKMIARCAARRWSGIVHDKILFQVLMQGYGFPMPRIIGTYHAQRSAPGAVALRDARELASFLRSSSYPLFGKPVFGMFSLGSIRLESYDADRDALMIHDRTFVSVAVLVKELARYAARGYLFQEVKHPAGPILSACGDRIACARIVILVGASGPEIFRALWKVPASANIADNFWRPGNLLAALDVGTGRLTRVVRGTGLEQHEVDLHPDSGVALIGMHLPHWQKVKELTLSGARVLSGLSMQAWDIALCPEGPVVIEVNVGGDFNLPQLAAARGLFDPQFAKFLRRTGYLS
jgi:hypothetical protein